MNKIFTRADCSLVLPIVPPEDITPPNFAKKTFTNSHKTLKYAKVFSLESFPLYTVNMHTQHPTYLLLCRATSVQLREEECIFLRIEAKDFRSIHQASRRVVADGGDEPDGVMPPR